MVVDQAAAAQVCVGGVLLQRGCCMAGVGTEVGADMGILGSFLVARRAPPEICRRSRRRHASSTADAPFPPTPPPSLRAFVDLQCTAHTLMDWRRLRRPLPGANLRAFEPPLQPVALLMQQQAVRAQRTALTARVERLQLMRLHHAWHHAAQAAAEAAEAQPAAQRAADGLPAVLTVANQPPPLHVNPFDLSGTAQPTEGAAAAVQQSQQKQAVEDEPGEKRQRPASSQDGEQQQQQEADAGGSGAASAAAGAAAGAGAAPNRHGKRGLSEMGDRSGSSQVLQLNGGAAAH